MEFVSTQYTIITYFFICKRHREITSLVTVYNFVGFFNPHKDNISFWFFVGVNVLLCFDERCGDDEFFDQIFFRFWSRYPMVVGMDLLKY